VIRHDEDGRPRAEDGRWSSCDLRRLPGAYRLGFSGMEGISRIDDLDRFVGVRTKREQIVGSLRGGAGCAHDGVIVVA
jgi:hypothetical protein